VSFPVYSGYVSRTQHFCFICSWDIFLGWYLGNNALFLIYILFKLIFLLSVATVKVESVFSRWSPTAPSIAARLSFFLSSTICKLCINLNKIRCFLWKFKPWMFFGIYVSRSQVCTLSPNRGAGADGRNRTLPTPIRGAPLEMLLYI
jgi:hypothetical protein